MDLKKSMLVFAVSAVLMMVAGITTASAADFDLTIALGGVEGPGGGNHVAPGTYTRIDTYLTNNGPDPAPGRILVTGEVLPECPYLVGWYLSTDTTITTADTQIGGYCPNGLEAGQTFRFWADVYVPVNIEGGFYYWGAIADYNESLVETDETNNAATGARVNIR
jgi:hypothetical protein